MKKVIWPSWIWLLKHLDKNPNIYTQYQPLKTKHSMTIIASQPSNPTNRRKSVETNKAYNTLSLVQNSSKHTHTHPDEPRSYTETLAFSIPLNFVQFN